jgi:hypothetical protein
MESYKSKAKTFKQACMKIMVNPIPVKHANFNDTDIISKKLNDLIDINFEDG